jgi:xanthosine utilization system XapX-like protein
MESDSKEETMSRIKILSRGAWMVVGIVVALVLVPTAAFATLSFVGIEGTSLHKADVTAASQLLAAEASPAKFKEFNSTGFNSGSGCQTVASIPSTEGYVLRQFQLDVYADPTPGVGQHVLVYDGAGCSGTVISDVNPGSVGVTVVPFTPGIGIAPLGAISAEAFSSVQAEIYALGYTVPPADVPSSTAVVGSSSPPQR